MEDKTRILLVTANKNETNALISDPAFVCKDDRSSDPNDTTFYNVGKFGAYNVVHFELNCQGSVKSESAILAVHTAIQQYHPDAVILVGIAFGKDSGDSNSTQKIGTVLISEKVADYESGKIKNGEMQSDGAIPESGQQLLSAFKHYAKTWNYEINGEKVDCEFGTILSGDKVVDDPEFKKVLFERYPRAIGGEMEGRGAYAACRRNNLNEWIVIKAICDWGDGDKSVNKQERQVIASESAVSLLKHLFTNPKAFEKLSKLEKKNKEVDKINQESDEVIGYFINFGITTCRLFKILKNKSGVNEENLKESKVISYDISNPKDKGYFDGIIKHVINEILPEMQKSGEHIFFKAFADAVFSEVFSTDKERDRFISNLYGKTGLYFNILTQKQTEENLKTIFKNTGSISAIINIGSMYIEMLVYSGRKYHMYNFKLSLEDVANYISKHAIPEVWDESHIEEIKDFIKCKISNDLRKIKADRVVIIKNELDFMNDLGYPLKREDGSECLTIDEYKEANRELLFGRDYKAYVDKECENSQGDTKRYYGFKNGHIILETIFDLIGAKVIIPSNELSIHGSKLAYIFNVVISGSTNMDNVEYMIEAYNIMKKKGLTVLSPHISRGKLRPQSIKTHQEHACAIRDCDLLFISNKSGYIGEQTKREIYGAYLLNKPIAFWKEPVWNESEAEGIYDNDRLDYIPHEQWWDLMRVLKEDSE